MAPIGGSYSFYPIYGSYHHAGSMKVPPVQRIQGDERLQDVLFQIGKTPKTECQTCKERKYVDGSNENNVSFQTPGHIPPSASTAVVSAHEQEHVQNAVNEGRKSGVELISANVRLHMGVCPECGRVYTAGGTTTTQLKYTDEDNPYQKAQKMADELLYKGANIDYAA